MRCCHVKSEYIFEGREVERGVSRKGVTTYHHPPPPGNDRLDRRSCLPTALLLTNPVAPGPAAAIPPAARQRLAAPPPLPPRLPPAVGWRPPRLRFDRCTPAAPLSAVCSSCYPMLQVPQAFCAVARRESGDFVGYFPRLRRPERVCARERERERGVVRKGLSPW